MIPVYIGAAFIAGIVIGALLARSYAIVKMGPVEIRAASVREVACLLKLLQDSAAAMKGKSLI